jgi:hypothetical protein
VANVRFLPAWRSLLEEIAAFGAQTAPSSSMVILHHNLLTDRARSRDWEWAGGILS